jgi:hypothetical protein
MGFFLAARTRVRPELPTGNSGLTRVEGLQSPGETGCCSN